MAPARRLILHLAPARTPSASSSALLARFPPPPSVPTGQRGQILLRRRRAPDRREGLRPPPAELPHRSSRARHTEPPATGAVFTTDDRRLTTGVEQHGGLETHAPGERRADHDAGR